jgi:molybdenum cofactor cytidylyltransferase
MIFADLPVGQCAGAILAHALRGGTIAFKKGRILSAADIELVKQSGRTTITVAKLEPGDVGEDADAAALGAVLSAEGLRVEAPFTGRVNIYARGRGILRVDAALVDAVNEIDESVTLATLADYAPVEPDQMVATVKIIPFAVKRTLLDACIAAARRAPILAFHPFRPRRLALIQTALAATKPALLD